MELSPNDSFCSLDMLAEVASATLKNDLSLCSHTSSREIKYNISKISIGSPSRKNVNNSEKLTLDQIKVLSDKMLIEMFSELICDEIRKNYSFKCFLIPDKCSQIFKSFGSEARARCKMKSHLQSHINDLVSEENGNICKSFTAEPLHIRRKRLKELNTKSVRKKKKSKLLNSKKRKDAPTIDFYQNDINIFKAMKPRKICSVSNVYKSSNINLHHNFGQCVSTHFDTEIEDISYKFSPNYQESFHSSEQISFRHYSVDRPSEMFPETNNMMQKFYTRRNNKKKNICSTPSDYVVKWNVDFDETSIDNSPLLDFELTNTDSSILSHHDHTYTSVHGKTYYDLSSGEYNRTITNAKKSRSESTHPLLIPTPPFPYVYVPLLPHIAEIKEIGNSSNSTCGKCSKDYVTSFHENYSINPTNMLSKNSVKKELQFCEINNIDESAGNDLFTEEDENMPCHSFLDDVISENNFNAEVPESGSWNSVLNLDNILKTDCPENLQSVEKKLALKCIRALHTKKKDERGPLVCQICKNKSFTAQATLMYHYRSHAGKQCSS